MEDEFFPWSDYDLSSSSSQTAGNNSQARVPSPSRSRPALTGNASSLDSTGIQWTYNVLGRRLLFRPVFKAGYKDAEDYYHKSYDPTTGLRVAVALGSLMLLVCGIALYNRYGFFRKRRKLHVSLRGSKEQLQFDIEGGIEEWLRVIAGDNSSALYNPVCSDQDLPRRFAKPRKDVAAKGRRATFVQGQRRIDDRLVIENEADSRRLSWEMRTFSVVAFPPRTTALQRLLRLQRSRSC